MKSMKRIILSALVVLLVVPGLISTVHAEDLRSGKPWVLNTDDQQTWGNRFSIGIPVGLFMNDMVVGLDFTFAVLRNFSIRLDTHVLINPDIDRVVLNPAAVFILKSPMINRMKFYGGLSVGPMMEVTDDPFPLVAMRGFGGIEFYGSHINSWFMEAGGGGIFSKSDPGFGRGVVIRAGTRFHL